MSSMVQKADNVVVGLVKSGAVERCEIDACCSLRFMPHALADHRHGYIIVVGYARPRVAGHIQRQRFHQTYAPAYILQMSVDKMRGAEILPPFVLAAWLDHRQDVGRFIVLISVGYRSHRLLPFYGELLACLPAAICQDAVMKILFPQVRHIHRCHAACVEAEQKHIPCHRVKRAPAQIQCTQLPHRVDGHRPFHCLRHSRIDGSERIAMRRIPTGHGHIVDGAESAHIIRGGVRTQSFSLEITLITAHKR